MKLPSFAVVVTVAAFVIGAAGCGSGHGATVAAKPSATGSASSGDGSVTAEQRDNDNDNDNPSTSRYDRDDDEVLHFGHAASAADRRAITALVKRYYAAGAASDGKLGCSLIYSPVEKSVVEDYGRRPGSPALHGNTCSVLLGELFKLHASELRAEFPRLRVTGVRVKESSGIALLNYRHVLVHREFGRWRMGALLDAPMP